MTCSGHCPVCTCSTPSVSTTGSSRTPAVQSADSLHARCSLAVGKEGGVETQQQQEEPNTVIGIEQQVEGKVRFCLPASAPCLRRVEHLKSKRTHCPNADSSHIHTFPARAAGFSRKNVMSLLVAVFWTRGRGFSATVFVFSHRCETHSHSHTSTSHLHSSPPQNTERLQ